MSALPAITHKDPTELGFPPTLPLELAARTGSIAEICESYGVTREQFEKLKENPVFVRACAEALALVSEQGGSFKAKAATMAEQFLANAYDLVNEDSYDKVSAAVRADIIKFIIRAAGRDASVEQKAAAAGKAVGNALQININLGG